VLYHYECQYAPFKAVPMRSAEAPVVYTLPPNFKLGINSGNLFASIAVVKDAGPGAMRLGWIDFDDS
jgi:hypothetical protein